MFALEGEQAQPLEARSKLLQRVLRQTRRRFSRLDELAGCGKAQRAARRT